MEASPLLTEAEMEDCYQRGMAKVEALSKEELLKLALTRTPGDEALFLTEFLMSTKLKGLIEASSPSATALLPLVMQAFNESVQREVQILLSKKELHPEIVVVKE